MLWIIIGVVLTVTVPFLMSIIYDFRNLRHVGTRHMPKRAARFVRYWFQKPEVYSIDIHEESKREVRHDWFWGVAALSAVMAVGLNVFFDMHSRIPQDRYTYLTSMGDAIGTKGRFFLGSGTIESDPVYSYYWKDGTRYRLSWVPSRRSYVTYSDETPVLVHHGDIQRYSRWFSVGAEDDFRLPYSDAYEFKIPEGSIQQQFVLDAS